MSNKEKIKVRIKNYNYSPRNNLNSIQFYFINDSDKEKKIRFIGILKKKIEKEYFDDGDIISILNRKDIESINETINIPANSEIESKPININNLEVTIGDKEKKNSIYYALYCELNTTNKYIPILYKFVISKQKTTYFKEIVKKMFAPIPFTLSMVSTFIIQYAIANNWLNQGINNFEHLGWFIAVLIGLTSIDWIYNIGLINFRKLKSITPLDIFICWILLTLLFNLLISIIFRNIIFGIIISTILILISFITIRRYRHINDKKVTPSISGKELINLGSLFDHSIAWKKSDGAILVDERAVDYDLFNRKNTKRQLIEAIEHFSSQHAYVVGLVGKWGLGKTTILNNAKHAINTDEYTFIYAPGSRKEDFDLWVFGSQEELINGLYNAFLSSMGIKYNSFWSNKMLDSVAKVVVGIPNIGNMVSPLIFNSQPYKEVNKLKQKLSNYIKSTNKHYVMCIENLDRADNEQVILLLKLLSTIFDLPNTTYVLLYDKDRLNNILENTNKTNISYAAKVINQEVMIPSTVDKNVCKKCLQNLLLSYKGVDDYNLEDYDYVLNAMVDNLADIRELKRIINSVFTILAIKDKLRLNLPQVLAIQYIYFKDKELYDEIRKNKKIFAVDMRSFVELKESEEKKLNNIKSNYSNMIQLLENLFIVVQKIELGFDELKNNLKYRSIGTQRYFDNYFLLTENNYVDINNYVRNIINNLNIDNIEENWKDIINSKYYEKVVVLQELKLFLEENDIQSSSIREKFAEVIFTYIIGCKDKSKYHNDKYNLEEYIGVLIGSLEKIDLNKFEDFIEKSGPNMKVISNLASNIIYKYMKREFIPQESIDLPGNYVSNTNELENFYKKTF